MATWPAYTAGSARLNLRPKLADTFKADVKTLLSSVTETLDVTVSPKLERRFKSNLKDAVKTASEGVVIKIPVEAKILGFKTDLTEKVKTASEGIKVKVPVEAKILGFKTDLRDKVKLAQTGITVKVPVSPKLAADFKTTVETDAQAALVGADVNVQVGASLTATFVTDLQQKVDTATTSVTGAVVFSPELTAMFKTDLISLVDTVLTQVNPRQLVFEPSLRAGFTADLKTALGGVVSKLRSVTKIEFRPALVKGFRTDLRTKLTTSTGTLSPKIPVDVDLTSATAQLTAFRTAQHAIPLTLNVNIDSGAALASLMALRALAGALNSQVSDLGSGLGRGNSRTLRGNWFTKAFKSIRIQVELDRDSVNRAQAELANLTTRRVAAQQRQIDATDKLTLANQRHAEVMARVNATASQRTAADQALTRARLALARATGDWVDLLGREAEAYHNVGNARDRADSRTRGIGAAFRSVGNSIRDAMESAVEKLTSLSTWVGVAKVGLIALAAVSLVPLIGQLVQAAGVVAILPASVAGLVSVFATLKFAMSGIGDAFSAASKVADNASDDAKSKAKAVASARKQAASAAKSVESAERGIISAERGVREAQKDSLDAQKDLDKARKTAARNIDDMNRSLRRSKLDEEGAALSVAEAYQNLYEVFADADSDGIDRARAQLSVKEALADQEDTIARTKQLAEDTAEANEKGIEGSDEVVSAKERITDAAQAEVDAQQSLQDAYDTLAEAQSNLVEAQAAVTEAMSDNGSAADDFERALGKLSGSARDFVTKMLELKPAWEDFKRSVQEKFFSGLGDSVQNLAKHWLPTLSEGLGGIADQINGALRRAIADLDTDASRSKLTTIFENIKNSIGPVVDGINNLIQGFLSLAGVGTGMFPSMGQTFLDKTEQFRAWAESPDGQGKFRDFLENSFEKLGKIWDLIKQIGRVFWELFKGSDETGSDWLGSMTDKLKKVADFLSTPEGQKKVMDFFKAVQEIVRDIYKIVMAIAKVADAVLPEGGLDAAWEQSPVGGAAQLFDDEKSVGERAGGLAKGIGGGIWNYTPVGWAGKAVLSQGEDMWNQAKDGWNSFTNLVAERTPDVVGWFANAGISASNLASDIQNHLGEIAGGAISGLMDRMPGFGEIFRSTLGGAGLDFGAFENSVFGVVGNLTGSEGFSRISGAFGGVVDAITGGNGLERLRDAFGALPGFFETVVIDITKYWGKLASKLTGPINTVIDILNSGIGGVWNSIDSLLGLGKPWTPISKIGSDGAVEPQYRALGGPIYGPGGPTEDKIPTWLSNGEHVWTAAEVQAAGGHQAMQQMRQAVLARGGQQSKSMNYAVGGEVQFGSEIDRWMADTIQSAFPDAVINSAYRPGHSGFHGKAQAIDIGGPMQQVADWIYSAYPQSAQLIYGPGPLLYNVGGTTIDPSNQAALQGVYAADLPGHFDHAHWAANEIMGDLSEEDRRSLFDRIRSGIGGLVNRGRSALVENTIAKPLRALVGQIPAFEGFGEFGAVPKALASKVVESIISKLAGSSGGSSGSPNYNPTAGVEQWRSLAIEAMRREGFNPDDPNQLNAMLAQIGSESGGRPAVVQQVQDVNSGGNEAVGLLQIIPDTFARHRDPTLPDDRTDPFANMVAALRYYRARYGSDLTTDWGKGRGYDSGGIFPNNTFGWNMSGAAEAVLTNPQWKLLRQFGQQLGLMPQEVQQLPQQTETTTDESVPNVGQNTQHDSGVDTAESLWTKTQERFKSVWDTGLTDMIDSNLGALGISDLRDSPWVTATTDYASDVDTWAKAKAATAQATQAAQTATVQAQSAGTPVSAAQVVTEGQGGTLTSYDYSTVINIQTSDTDEAYRKAQQIANLRAIQHAR